MRWPSLLRLQLAKEERWSNGGEERERGASSRFVWHSSSRGLECPSFMIEGTATEALLAITMLVFLELHICDRKRGKR